MSTKITRPILLASLIVFGLLKTGSVFAVTCSDPTPQECNGSCIYATSLCCPKDQQPCNGGCIPETSLCILEPLPGTSAEIPASTTPFEVFEDYINGTAGGFMGGPSLWTWAVRIGVAIAVLNGVVGGFQIVLSNGDSSKIDAGKNRFIGSAIGLAMLLLAGVILNFINPYGFGTPTTPAL